MGLTFSLSRKINDKEDILKVNVDASTTTDESVCAVNMFKLIFLYFPIYLYDCFRHIMLIFNLYFESWILHLKDY